MTRCTVPAQGWSCSREAGHSGPCAASLEPIKPFSTYPEDRAKLLDLARKCEHSDDANAFELGDLVRAILEDEIFAISIADEELEDLFSDAMSSVHDMDTGINDFAKACVKALRSVQA